MRLLSKHLVCFIIVLQLSGAVGGCQKATNAKDETAMPKQNAAKLNSTPDEELSHHWRKQSEQYVAAINDFVRRGDEVGWKDFDEKEPEDHRQLMAEAVLDVVRRANQSGEIEGLRDLFPPAHSPFMGWLNENGQSLPVVFLLDDGRIILQIGASYSSPQMVVIADRNVIPLSADILTLGRSPNREFFAIAREEGITIHRGWDGPQVATLKWPTGLEGIPEEYKVTPLEGRPNITRLIPFNSGDRALLVSPEGVFVLMQNRATRLLPTQEQLKEHFEWIQKEYPGDTLSYNLSMEHGALSPDGKMIAAGEQTSLHLIFDAESCNLIAEIGNLSSYPHYAAFSCDGSMLALNSCHFYNGTTIVIPTSLLPGLKTEPYELDDRLVQIEDSSRVYAAVSRKDEFIIGDANGYLRAFDFKGIPRWRHFIGSSVGDIDISRDGRRLVMTTYAGFLCILDLDTGKSDPFAIGNSEHQERRRWLFWKQEEKPLIW